MPNARSYARSFAGGEVTPEFFARFDDTKNQTGLQTCRNMIVKPHGPVSNRGGLRFIAKAKNSTTATAARVLPFVYSSDQSVVIEVGAGYFRFFALGAVILSGGVPYEVANPYAAADLATIKFVQSNDVLTLVHSNYPPAELRRLGAASWQYQVISFVSALAAPTSVSATATPAVTSPGTPTLQTYVVTAVQGSDESAASQADSGGTTTSTQPTGNALIDDISNANPGVFHLQNRGTLPSVGQSVYVSGVGGMTQVNGVTATVASIVATHDPGGGFIDGYNVTLTGVNTTTYSTYTGGGTMGVSSGGTVSTSGVGTCLNNLFDPGAYNTIAWAPVTGAERYYVYKLENGLFGYLGQTLATSFKDDNIAPDLSKTPPILNNPFSSAGNYPGAVGYYEQRRFFAGTGNDPAYFWGTRSGTESNLAYSIPTRDDDSIRVRIAARQRSEIRHIVPLINLVLLSESMEWRVSASTGEALTPDVAVQPQSGIGTAQAPPVVVNNNILFASARGGHLREMGFNQYAGGYITGDLCLRAPHLFDDYQIVDTAYAKAPLPIVWCVSSSGKLLGLTYVPDQQVGAWHQHDTKDGTFESICVVPEDGADALYAVVRRTTALGSELFIERLETRRSTDDSLGFFVDCGLTYDGGPATTFSGLDHLNGKTVTIVADGGVAASQIVAGGSVTIDTAASLVHVGLPVTADVMTLPAAFETEAFGQGRQKNVNKVWLRLFSSRDVSAGPTFANLKEYRPRVSEPYGAAPDLLTQEIEIVLSSSWGADGIVCIRHTAPLPFTLLSITAETAVAG